MVSLAAVRSPVLCVQSRHASSRVSGDRSVTRAFARSRAVAGDSAASKRPVPSPHPGPHPGPRKPEPTPPPPPPQENESLCNKIAKMLPSDLPLPQCPSKAKSEAQAEVKMPPAKPVVIKLPKKLQDRFSLALQAQCLPWAESEATLRALWHEDCSFQDPVLHADDREQFIRYLGMMDQWGRTVRVDVQNFTMQGNTGMATGRLYYKVKGGPDMVVDYSTCMLFKDGRIIEHRDYWDVFGTIASTVLGKGKLPE